jgi:hypothetical protein
LPCKKNQQTICAGLFNITSFVLVTGTKTGAAEDAVFLQGTGHAGEQVRQPQVQRWHWIL